jgi:hypothetical protein
MDYWPARLKQKHIKLQSFTTEGKESQVDELEETAPVMKPTDEESRKELDSAAFGQTVRGPLGWIVHGRSGDKGGSEFSFATCFNFQFSADVNCGLFVRHADEYEWLCQLLSKKNMAKFLAKEYVGDKLERVEFPGLLAVHFVRLLR